VQPRFDPYQHWLGIPAAEQPPHHYRLLGIPPLEPNPEVIRQAAQRQAAHVRRFQSSQYLAVTNKLLGDIAAAASCLLDPRAKAAYDAQLRERLPAPVHVPPWAAGASAPVMAPGAAAQPSPPAPPPAAAPAGPPPPVAAPPVAGPPGSSAPGPAPPGPVVSAPLIRKTPVLGAPAVALFAVAVAALAAVLVLVFSGEEPASKSRGQVAGTPNGDAAATLPENPDGAGQTANPPEPVQPDLKPEAGPPDEQVGGQRGIEGEGVSGGADGNPAASPEEPPPEPVAKTSQRLGNAEVAILSATIGREASARSLTDGGLTLSDPDAASLVINVELRNLSDTEPLKYLSWAGLWAFDVPVALRDERQCPYRQKTPVDRAYANQPEAEPNVFVLTEENFREKVLQAEKPVLVQFYAPWSEACRMLKGQVDHLSAAYAEKVIVGRFQVADADEPGKYKMTPVLKRYKISSIPAVIVFHKGRPAAGWIGPPPLSTMEEALDALLPPKPPPHETLAPGGVVRQRLIFEPPADDAKELRLTLPASAVGEEGVFELVMPRSMITRTGDDEAITRPE